MNDKVNVPEVNTANPVKASAPTEVVAHKTTITPNTENYRPSRSSTGAKSVDNGDVVALACEGLTISEMYLLAEAVIGTKFDYSKLNIGMQRMNLGNRIRGKIGQIDKANVAAVAKDADARVTTGADVFSALAVPFTKAKASRLADAKTAADAAVVAKDIKAAAAKVAAAKVATDKANAVAVKKETAQVSAPIPAPVVEKIKKSA